MEYTPLPRFRKFITRVSALATAFGNELQLRGFKTGGTAGNVPIKTNGTDYNWSWGQLQLNNVFNLITTLNTKALITNTSLVVPTYANNAAAVAGGLAVNRLYKTASGELRIVV